MTLSEQTCSKRIEQICSKATEQTCSLKGLFKGKGGISKSQQLVRQSREAKSVLLKLMNEVLEITRQAPFSYFPIRLRIQNSGRDQTSKLRWRSHNMKIMGVKVWKDILLKHPKITPSIIDEFCHMEDCRILLNAEMSFLDYLIKQHLEYQINVKEMENTKEMALMKK